MANKRRKSVDTQFPPETREYIEKLFKEYNFTLIPHSHKCGIQLRGLQGGKTIHVSTLRKFLKLSEQQQRTRLQYVQSKI